MTYADQLHEATGPGVPAATATRFPLQRIGGTCKLHAELPAALVGRLTKEELEKVVTAINLATNSARKDISEARLLWLCLCVGVCLYMCKASGIRNRLGRNVSRILRRENEKFKNEGRGLEYKIGRAASKSYIYIEATPMAAPAGAGAGAGAGYAPAYPVAPAAGGYPAAAPGGYPAAAPVGNYGQAVTPAGAYGGQPQGAYGGQSQGAYGGQPQGAYGQQQGAYGGQGAYPVAPVPVYSSEMPPTASAPAKHDY